MDVNTVYIGTLLDRELYCLHSGRSWEPNTKPLLHKTHAPDARKANLVGEAKRKKKRITYHNPSRSK